MAKAVLVQVAQAEVRARLEELSHTQAGFGLKAWIARNNELKSAGREWTDADLKEFLDVRLPAALRAGELHQKERGA